MGGNQAYNFHRSSDFFHICFTSTAITTLNGGQTLPNGEIDGLRDLEDFTRLHLNLDSYLIQLAVNGDVQIGFKWVDGSGPRIRIYPAADPNGGLDYLIDPQKANEQCSGDFYVSIADVKGTQPTFLTASYWQGLMSQPIDKRCFLFEGCEEGVARLATVVKFGSNEEVSVPGPWIKIMDVRRMFERAKVGFPFAEPDDVPDAWITGADPDPMLTYTSDPWGYQFEADPDENKQYIVYVHGWRLGYGETQTWAQTTFKRLWHHGFKGRFALFRWPTFSEETHPLTGGRLTYNDSEYRAWLSGAALASYVNSLPSGYQKYVMAHSMGNVVVGSAFRAGMADVSRYAMFNAAMAHMAYGTSEREYASRNTPDNDVDEQTSSLGLFNKFNPMPTSAANFYLSEDVAMKRWQDNHAINKPELLTLQTWNYFRNFPNLGGGGSEIIDPPNMPSAGNKLWHNIQYYDNGFGNVFTGGRRVTKLTEAMAYLVQSLSKPAGNTNFTAGSVQSSESMDGYGFGDTHSAEWRFSVQKTFDCFTALLDFFQIDSYPN